MRRALLAGLAVVLGTALVLAQDHSNNTEKLVKQTITLPSETRVGAVLLKAGDYRVICDRETIVFQSHGKDILKAECKGEELSAPSPRNEVHTSPTDGGTRVLTKLLLKGSNVEHTF
jgi:hypothetical protein